MTQLLPRYRLVDEQAEREQRLRLVIRESESSVSTPVGRAGGDRRQMRGVPIVHKEVSGAIPGTTPGGGLFDDH